MLTRYALIDPLLRELGWDTEDPSMVVPEYRSGRGSADYALLVNGSPAMMVEAKKLGTPLHDSVLEQVLNYCMMEGTNHFSITDGAHWEIYETHKPVPIDEKRITEFNLNDPSPSQACLNALALWRPNVQSDSVTVGSSPLLEPNQEMNSSAVTAPAIKVASPVPHLDQALDQHGWQSLSDVSWVKGHPAPVEIRFPDNSSVTVSSWNRLMIEPVRWLTNGNILTSSQCPIKSSPTAKRYLVAAEAVHATGIPMAYPRLVNQLHVELNYSARDCLRHSKTIIQHVGLDPADFKVRFS